MTLCQECSRRFPDDLINSLVIGAGGQMRRRSVCPICALAIRNRIVDLPADTPFEGQHAQALFVRAQRWVKEHLE